MGTERTNRPSSSDSSKAQRPEDKKNEQRSGGGMHRTDKDSQRPQERSGSTSKPGSHSGSSK